MLSAMARELVECNGIGETADAVWKALNAEHQKLFPASHRVSDDSCGEELAPTELGEAVIEPAPMLIFGQRASPLGRRGKRARPSIPEQPSLFGFN